MRSFALKLCGVTALIAALVLPTAPALASDEPAETAVTDSVAAPTEELDMIANVADSRPVYRFWSSKFDNAHFYTVSQSEAQGIYSKDPNWAYEGQDFRVWPTVNGGCQAGTIAVYRFWSSKFESHFYTTSTVESDLVRRTDKNWSYEGAAFCTATPGTKGTQPVYRFWSSKFGKHFYTANQSEADALRRGDRNWTYEGIAMYSPTSGGSSPQLTGPAAPKPAQPGPGQSKPGNGYSCPEGYPIKGNKDSGIYHVPGQRFYDRTKPEECFANEADAQRAGYRKAKI
ncbi:hypothetical protein GCM10010922_24190 [Microbacterium sorbitolivorans]|uniref:sunset domain-containing protein n=1 Tax=Microbacterium sorbitolivorans TaxID=1867410 RepID=UPI0019930820|nr:hypothetical protein [Microbacterium sorbitolivorans]GGF47523.1 hypothetical protein GCM10010922_24190 [Microbacterium sorbitolivorans]